MTARTVDTGELVDAAAALFADGHRLALVAGHDDTSRTGRLRAVYLFTADDDRRTELHVELPRDRPQVPSLAGISFTAGRFEREMHDLYGIVPVDHPLPRRLVRHFHWPKGWHPMLDDAGAPPAFGDVDGPYPFRTVEGPGVYEIPVGPVHAGMIEPGHFRFSVVGETILKLKARLWFVHRGVEKLFHGRLPADAVELAERVSGDTSVGHTVAFCRAVEDATGVAVSADAQRTRALLLKLERLYNHVTDIGALCNDVGHGILNAHALRVREQLLRLNDDVTGHRLLRGAVRPGDATVRRLPDPARVAAIGADVAEIVALALGHSVVRDRFTGTAVLTDRQARDLGTLGYVARASREGTGDVLARFQVRATEVDESVAAVARLVDAMGTGGDVEPGGAGRSGVGIAPAWRGTVVHRVEVDDAGRLLRTKIVDPSFLNWPALPVALADTIVPDFPLVNKSFNLSYAGNDL